MDMQKLYLLVPLAPLLGAAIAGLFCRVIPRWVAHTAAIAGVAIALSLLLVAIIPIKVEQTSILSGEAA